MQETKDVGVTLVTIEELFGVKSDANPSIAVPAKNPNVPLDAYPKINKDYVFPGILFRKLMRFLNGQPARRNVMLIGEPGVGKTSIINEICGRLNIPVFALACSGKVRLSHMVGSYELVNGQTRWRDGPLVQAMRHGGVFLANEVTRLDAGEQMALAEVLDSRAAITIPDTGEVVVAAPSFRFVGTGNSGGYGDMSGAYAGERVSSVAFLDRFQVFEVHHLQKEEEVELLASICPGTPRVLLEGMVEAANTVRESFVGRGGSLRIPFSTRSLAVWALEAGGYSRIKGLKDPMEEALKDTVLNGAPKEEAEVVLEIWQKWARTTAAAAANGPSKSTD